MALSKVVFAPVSLLSPDDEAVVLGVFRELRKAGVRLFYQAFPNCDALRHELSWTHYRSLIRVEDSEARLWYMNEAASQNWNTRALDRQIGTLYYERLLASQDRQSVRKEATAHIGALALTPRDIVRDPVMLEFLGPPNTGRLLESRLEDALIGHLQTFTSGAW